MGRFPRRMKETGPMAGLFESLALVPVGLETLPVLVLRHLLATLFDERTHAKTSLKRGKTPSWSRGTGIRSTR